MIHFTLYEDDLVDIVNMYLVGFFLRSYIYGSKEDFLRCNTFLLYYHNDPTLWPEPPTKGKEHYRENFGFGFFENIYGS